MIQNSFGNLLKCKSDNSTDEHELIPGGRLGREVRGLVRVGGGRRGVLGLSAAGILVGVVLLLGVGVVGRERGQGRHRTEFEVDVLIFCPFVIVVTGGS